MPLQWELSQNGTAPIATAFIKAESVRGLSQNGTAPIATAFIKAESVKRLSRERQPFCVVRKSGSHRTVPQESKGVPHIEVIFQCALPLHNGTGTLGQGLPIIPIAPPRTAGLIPLWSRSRDTAHS